MIESKAPAPEGTGTSNSDQTDATSVAALTDTKRVTTPVYAAAYPAYRDRGWSPIKLRAGTKWPPPVGFTGHNGADPSYADCLTWAEDEPGGNIALRLPDGVIGIDVDAYGTKTGGETFAEAVRRWGPLPDAPRSSSRADGPVSGIRLFRVPAGTRLVTMLGFPELSIGDIEIIQRHHRYAVCWPSVHPEGRIYQWRGPGRAVVDLPAADGLPDLPPAWLAGMADDDPVGILTEDRADIGACLTEGEPSVRVAGRLASALAACQGSSRHDNTLGNVLALLRFGRQNDPGVKAAVRTLGLQFIAAVASDRDGGAAEAADEYRRMVYSDRAAAELAYDDTDWMRRIPPEGIGLTNGQVTPAPPGGSPPDDGQAGSDAATGRGQSIEPVSLADARDVFRRWLGDDYDIDALDAVLVTAAVEALDGDPLWLLLISGSGNAKTETVQCLDGIGAVVTATITEGGLLSATPRKERAKDATGGLLRKLEPRGVLVIKDVTSILSMNTETRAQVLGALREVYDGRWSRNVGTDGGRTLEWTGRIAVVGAVTTAWDKAHSVIASMGDRFVLIRMDSTAGRVAAGRKAIGNTGSEVEMRAELAAAAAGVLAGMNPVPVTLTDAETEVLLAAADLVTLARTGVEYDYRGDVTDAHAPEMPTRFAKQLAQIVRGGVAIGMDRLAAIRLAIRAARDSVPPMRLAIIDDVAKYPNSSTADVRRRIDKPRATVDRQLQALHMLGVLDCDEADGMHRGKPVTLWYYRLAENIEPGALDPTALADLGSVPDLPPPSPNPNKERAGGAGRVPSTLQPLSGKSGTALGAAAPTPCVHCGEPVVAGQRDDTGRPAHLSCRQTLNGG